MKVDRRTLAPLHCASTDTTRYTINSLHFAADGTTVATNGHIMAVVTPADENRVSLEPFAVEASTLKNLNSEQRKARSIAADLDVTETNTNGRARIVSAGIVTEIPKLAGDFPQWKQIHKPINAPAAELGISLAILEAIVATARQYTGTKRGETCALRFEFAGPTDLFSASVLGDDGSELAITAMPCKFKK